MKSLFYLSVNSGLIYRVDPRNTARAQFLPTFEHTWTLTATKPEHLEIETRFIPFPVDRVLEFEKNGYNKMELLKELSEKMKELKKES